MQETTSCMKIMNIFMLPQVKILQWPTRLLNCLELIMGTGALCI